MKRLSTKGLTVDLQILDKKVSSKFKRAMTEHWKIKFQLVPPDIHCRNVAERAIQTLKFHFITILVGVTPGFSRYMWDNLLQQAELSLNLIHQSTLNPKLSAWEYFNGPLDY